MVHSDGMGEARLTDTAGEARLADVRAADGSGDDEALDLRRPLEDRVDLRVAVHSLDRVLAGVAVTTEDLDRLLGDPDRGLAGEQLALRAFRRLERLALPRHPCRPPHEQPRRVDAGLHV